MPMDADALAPWLLAVRVAFYAAALLAAGTALHAALGVVERGGRYRAMLIAAAAALAALLFSAARLLVIDAQLGGGFDHAFDPSSFAWTWRMQGNATLALVAGCAAIWIAIPTRLVWIGGAGGVAVAASFAFSGHSQALDPPGFAPWAVGLHVLIAAFWFAAPLSLWPRRRLDDGALQARLARFSSLALFVVPLLFALGLWLAWTLAGGFTPLVSSLYGRLLIAKLCIAALALAIGAANKLVITKAVANNPASGRRMLAISLATDVSLFVVALGLVGWATTMTGPPSI